MSEGFIIKKAVFEEINQIAELFSLYRKFYGQQTDIIAETAFISERINNSESVIFAANIPDRETKQAVGFVQLYPSFSSVSMKRVWILNDLFVKEEFRGMGIGKALLDQAILFSSETKSKGITLCTAFDNYPAQELYEKLNFKKNQNYIYYYLYNPN
jgi:ribosomal protein S18 acetylase RimI-like enzyme